ncbi:MAG: httm protein [Verrucomicrobiales bacterium]|nr:httm protein [Verrucomicrobiales bacterium]
MTADQYLVLTEQLVAVAVVISCLEYLVRPGVLSDHGLAGWPVGRLTRRWKTGPWGAVLDAILVPSRYRIVLLLRCGAAVMLLVPWTEPVPRVAALAIVVVSSLLAQVRSSYGHDGADQMCLVVGGAALVARIALVTEAALWFIALQACLAYATAGLKKAASPVWRSGEALPGVLGTTIYGNARAHRTLVRHPGIARLGCFSVIAIETAFPLALIGLAPVTCVLLALGVAFHASTVILMGLNTFFWAFTATYPAIVYVALAR